MATGSISGDAEQDIQAQIAQLRAQLDALVSEGSVAAAGIARDVKRIAASEMETVCTQMRTQPLATAVVALAGAAVGYILGRLVR